METAEGMAGSMVATRAHLGQVRSRVKLLLALTGAVLLLALVAVFQGSYRICLSRVLDVLAGRADATATTVIMAIRLPRVAAALVMGWGLSLSGLAIQALLKNPLGSSSTLGISHGAACGAAAAIVLLPPGLFPVTGCAFAGAMAAVVVILVLARLRRLTAEAVILAGVALSSLFAAASVLIQYLASETQLAVVVFWTFGDVARPDWHQIGVLAAAVTGASLYWFARRWDLNAVAEGEEAARGLGVNVERLRIEGMTVAALVAALATAFAGVIAFVGLVAPHMARRLVGEEHSFLIPLSALLGAGLLLGADTLARLVLGTGAMPVGIVTSFLGAPVFLYLLVRGMR